MSDLDTVAACADKVLAMGVPIDILMCNAGIMAPPKLLQKKGLELQFLTNHLGHFLLINRLLERLIAADQGRVLLVSSGGHTHSVAGESILTICPAPRATTPGNFMANPNWRIY